MPGGASSSHSGSIPLGLTLLYGSLTIHLALAFWSIYRRRSLRMPLWEAAQLLLGLMIPPLLAIHVIGSRGAHQLFGTDTNYIYELLILWVFSPKDGVQLAIVLVILWMHGCIGLHFWLRLKSWYPARAARSSIAAALLVPVLALLGFAAGGREVARLAEDPDWLNQAVAEIGFPDEARRRRSLCHPRLVHRRLPRLRRRRPDRPRRQALDHQPPRRGRSPTPMARRWRCRSAPPSWRPAASPAFPHASVCGGRGRCSTCRVRVCRRRRASAAAERRRGRARAGPRRRRAATCASPARRGPRGAVDVMPLLPPTASPRDAHARPGYLQGHEQEIAILFADLRAFTALAEHKLPYDVVFVLNRYFRAMGVAVEDAGGHLDKFIGDGVMALFGIGADPGEGCRQALDGARGDGARSCTSSTRPCSMTWTSRCASASASMSGRRSSARWATAAPPR